ncbi:exlusion protein FxsA, partial [Vibrio metoecus]
WFRLLCLSFVLMRCQPLRRALCDFSDIIRN